MQDLLRAGGRMKENLGERLTPQLPIDFVLKQHTLRVGESERFANVKRRLGKNRVFLRGRLYALGHELEDGRRYIGPSSGLLGEVSSHQPGRLSFHDRHASSGAVVASQTFMDVFG